MYQQNLNDRLLVLILEPWFCNLYFYLYRVAKNNKKTIPKLTKMIYMNIIGPDFNA